MTLACFGWYALQGNGPTVGAKRAVTLRWNRDQNVLVEVHEVQPLGAKCPGSAGAWPSAHHHHHT